MPTPGTGDSPRLDPTPALVDTSGEPAIEPEGDAPLAGTVILHEEPARPAPTAGELRRAGYGVPAKSTTRNEVGEEVEVPYGDQEVPAVVHAERPAPPNTVRLVDEEVPVPPPPAAPPTEEDVKEAAREYVRPPAATGAEPSATRRDQEAQPRRDAQPSQRHPGGARRSGRS
jgi:hypothetical protein